MNSAQSAEAIEKIRTFLRTNLSGKLAVVGISGGVDSALVLKLLSLSIDRDRIIALFLPDGKAPGNDAADVEAISMVTGVPINTINIHGIVTAFASTLDVTDSRALGNIKSRARMTVLYYYANLHNGIVVGTTNKSEYYTGYYTKFGDGGCDLEPILHLTKTEVWRMAKMLGIPESVIAKSPSAGLWEGQRDEDELGMKYEEIDAAVEKLVEQKKTPSNQWEKRVSDLIRMSDHKRRPPESML